MQRGEERLPNILSKKAVPRSCPDSRAEPLKAEVPDDDTAKPLLLKLHHGLQKLKLLAADRGSCLPGLGTEIAELLAEAGIDEATFQQLEQLHPEVPPSSKKPAEAAVPEGYIHEPGTGAPVGQGVAGPRDNAMGEQTPSARVPKLVALLEGLKHES